LIPSAIWCKSIWYKNSRIFKNFNFNESVAIHPSGVTTVKNTPDHRKEFTTGLLIAGLSNPVAGDQVKFPFPVAFSLRGTFLSIKYLCLQSYSFIYKNY
jgi:hypothetical protein